MANLWTEPNNYLLKKLNERIYVGPGELPLPLSTTTDVTVSVISGDLPTGMRIEGTDIIGTPVEEVRETEYTFVLRASTPTQLADRTLRLRVVGADEPRWVTEEGQLPIGPNNRLFILDNEIIDFKLAVIDPDLPAGDELDFYIAPGDGVLPPGIKLTPDGRLVGVVEPLLALDKQASQGGFGTNPYDKYPNDYAILSDSGYDSFFYDSVTYDFNFPTSVPRKLNRYYEFAVKVADTTSKPIRRKFQIYVVGDDFLTADNTIMKVANGVFTADNADVRTPRWVTPSDLGYIRADNYATIYLDTLKTSNVEGVVTYALKPQNPDGSDSVLPPGTTLDAVTGEVIGYVPGQPAVTREYKFTVLATRQTVESNFAVITLQVYEDTRSGQDKFKIYKLPVGTADGIDDLNDLRDQTIYINNKPYTVESVNGSNEDYEIITLTDVIAPDLRFKTAQQVPASSDSFYVDRISYADSQRWKNKKIIYSENEVYEVLRIEPYIEYKITSASGSIEIDYTAAGVEPLSGGNETLGSAINRIFSTELLPVEVITATDSEVRFVAPVTKSTSLPRLRAIFGGTGTDLVFTLIDDSRSLLQLRDPLSSTRTYSNDQTVGLGVFENDVIEKELLTNANLDIINPSSSKTFTIRVLGEVDSVITWNTPSDLGVINANFVSTLRVEAETSVPDARLIYTITDGQLPNGLRLSYRGEIIGSARQFATDDELGLTRIDGDNTTFDEEETTFDRVSRFTVKAADRFGFSAVEREFTLEVSDLDSTLYSNLYVQPFLKPEIRDEYLRFISDTKTFPPEDIYRPNDPSFGLQTDIRMLIYAGIESKDVENFVAAAAKNTKRRRYNVGDVKRAVAKEPGTNKIIYELVYLEVIDPAEPATGETRERFVINNKRSITTDSSGYDAKEVDYNGDLVNSEPRRQRNHPFNNTIKADSDAIIINQGGDTLRYLSNTSNMRKRIEEIGKVQREYLPLWMRTGQDNSIKELGYVTAIPIAYCKPGRSADVLLNVKNALSKGEFDFKRLDLDIDRYILDSTADTENERYIMFANYQFNE